MTTPPPAPISLDRPSPEQASIALERIAKAWGLDRYDMLALIRASERDLSDVAWTDDKLVRVAYLLDLERALSKLAPKFGIPNWVATPKPGPFFEGTSPLQMMKGTTQDLAELLRQIVRWRAS